MMFGRRTFEQMTQRRSEESLVKEQQGQVELGGDSVGLRNEVCCLDVDGGFAGALETGSEAGGFEALSGCCLGTDFGASSADFEDASGGCFAVAGGIGFVVHSSMSKSLSVVDPSYVGFGAGFFGCFFVIDDA